MDLSKEKFVCGARWVGLRVVAGIVTLYLLGMVLTCNVQNRILYPGAFDEDEVEGRPDVSAQGGEWLLRPVQEGGEVEALFYAARGVEPGGRAPLVVYLHGNGGRAEWTGEQLKVWRELGYHVLVPEYRGYGRSVGEPGAQAIAEDVMWFMDEVSRQREDVDSTRVILHGYSLGGAVAGEVARHRKPWMMVLRSTFSSMKSMANRNGYPGFLARDKYDTAEIIEKGDFPVLVTHGTRDRVIPRGESRKLAKAGGERVTRQVFKCGHNTCPPESEYRALVQAWHAEQVGP